MGKSDYYQIKDGEWVPIVKRNFYDQCCDCGLTHRRNFRVTEKGGIEMQTFRDNRATSSTRRPFRFTKEQED